MGRESVAEGDSPVRADEIRFLFSYDRWATHRVLDVLDGM